MTPADPNGPTDPTSDQDPTTELPSVNSSPLDPAAPNEEGPPSESAADGQRRRILIGSQRDPVAYRARQRRDWAPIEEKPKKERKKRTATTGAPRGRESNAPGDSLSCESNQTATAASLSREPAASVEPPAGERPLEAQITLPPPAPRLPRAAVSSSATMPPSPGPVPLPNLREKLSPELEDELNSALGDASFDELMGVDSGDATGATLEPESLQSGRVVSVRRDDVFVELGSREQGIVSLRQFDVPPTPGQVVQVMVQRFNPEDGLYELAVPNKAVQVDDWSDLIEGKLVEVRVTGHNAGGLECEVNHIRGFIPISQISLYRVEDLAPYVDQRLTCCITEADPDRRNLVLSHRAVLEREREQTRQHMLASLQPGQMHDGIVRKLMDFGAFVDIGGIDGLLHISQLAWGRVKHPSDVLQEGQKIRVRVEKIDPQTGKISLAYRDLLESPWTDASRKFPPKSVVRGTVTKLMEFGAFVELEPGIEGLVHVSELSHKRVWRPADVVHEGDQVEVLVLSVDVEAQRISLSMKAIAAPPEPVKKEDEPSDSAEAASGKRSQKKKHEGPLLGGLGRPTGDRFGLKW